MTHRPHARGGMNSVQRNHTPGPWIIIETQNGPAIASSSDRRVIASVRRSANERHDAALIRTAPRLLTLALQYASECGECGGVGVQPDNSPCEDCLDVRNVIAEATDADESSSLHTSRYQ